MVTATGITIADVPYVNRYSKIVDKYYTRHSTFMSRSNMDISYPCRTVVANNPIHPITRAVVNHTNTLDIVDPGAGNTIHSGFISYEEPRYFRVSGDDEELHIVKNIRLGDIGHSTFFEQDKDVYIGETIYINLDTAPLNTYVFTSTSATEITGAGAVAVDSVEISNFMLNVYVEDNARLSNSVRAKWEGTGINLRCDQVLPFRNVCNSQYTNISLQIPQMANTKLKRIINCVFNGVETLADASDHHNLNAEKISELASFIDSQQLQNSVMRSEFSTGAHLGNTDYVENERFLLDSVIQTVTQYSYTWAHIDDFSGDDSLKYDGEHQKHDFGLDLNVPRNYMLKMKTPNASNANNYAQYSFAIVSRTLHMGKDGTYWL